MAKQEKSPHMGGKQGSGKHHGLGNKQVGFGSKLAKRPGKPTSMEGPHK